HWPQTASASKTVEGCGPIRNLFRIKSNRRERAHHVDHGIGFVVQWAKATFAGHVSADAARVAVVAAAAGSRRRAQAEDALFHQATHFAEWCARLEFRVIHAAFHGGNRLLFTLGGALIANALRRQHG